MDYRILGPLEVVEHGHELPLGGARQRALLAVLLLHRREVVSVDHLIEALWGDDPPLTAAKTIQVYVSRLRKLLGAESLETCGRGYRLAVEPGSCDLDRFDALVARGQAALESGDAGAAVERLRSALALWRDPALDEFSAEPFAQAELAPLVEARLAVLEDRIDAELAMGRGPELVRELERLVAEHPLRERVAADLMVALYRAGRQADALAVYRAARERLIDELGLKPSPGLRELEQRILQHDPALSWRRPRDVSGVDRRPAARRALGVASGAGRVRRGGRCSAWRREAGRGTTDARARERPGRDQPRRGAGGRCRPVPRRGGGRGQRLGIGVGRQPWRERCVPHRSSIERRGRTDSVGRRAGQRGERWRRHLGREHGWRDAEPDRSGDRARHRDDRGAGLQPRRRCLWGRQAVGSRPGLAPAVRGRRGERLPGAHVVDGHEAERVDRGGWVTMGRGV